MSVLKSGWFKLVASTVALILVGLFLGIGVAHPKDGLSTALGSAKSSLVIYKETSEIVAGDRVVASVESENSPVFAVVTSTEGDEIAIQYSESFVNLNKEAVVGKMVVVIPFLGAIAGILGL